MAGIFLCYRGIDRSYGPVLVDRELSRRFRGHVFQAARSNTAATDIPDAIFSYIAQCSVFIVLIDKAWLADIELLSDEKDWIRREIAHALDHHRTILPVLLDGVKMPGSRAVPERIAAFTSRACARLTTRTVDADLARLIDEIEGLAPELVLAGLAAETNPVQHRPADLLRPEYDAFPARNRPELELLDQWCAATGDHPVRLITGPAGAGKTRLARMLTLRLRATGWAAGLLAARADPRALAGLGAVRTPTLLVIDDAETRPGLVRVALEALTEARDVRVRLLLAARARGEWFDELRTDPNDAVAALADGAGTVALEPLRAQDGDFATALHAFAGRLHISHPAGRPEMETPRPGTGTLLEVQAAALAQLLRATDRDEPPMRRLAERETHYWREAATGAGLDGLRRRNAEEIITAVTLFGADTETEADRLVAALRTFRRRPADTVYAGRDLIRTLLPGPAALNPLQPEQLALEIVARHLHHNGFPGDVVAEVSDPQAVRALVVLGRAYGRQLSAALRAFLAAAPARLLILAMTAVRAVPEPAELVDAMTQTVAEVPKADLDRLVAALPQRSEALSRFAVDVTERALAAASDPAGIARLSRLAATRLAYLGERPDDALGHARTAVSLGAETEPEERAEAWAVLALTAPPPEALAAGARAIAAYDQLPAGTRRHTGALATALHNQAVRLSAAGDLDAALPLARRAHDVTTVLSTERRNRFLSLHADVQDHLATLLARTGDLERAERLSRETLGVRRTLAAARPDAYTSSLAATLHNLAAIVTRGGGHPDEAARLRREADAIRRRSPRQPPERDDA